jgi:hypothetical protein
LADLLDSIRAQLRTRLDELRPLVGEYDRLQQAEAALADGSSAGTRAAESKRRASQTGRGGARRPGARRRSRVSGEREANREKLLVLVRERPGITKADLKAAGALSSAAVAQNVRRMLDRAQVREEASPSGAIGYRITEDRAASSPSGTEGDTGS